MLKKEDPDLVFHQETKVKASFFATKKFIFGYNNFMGVDCYGKSRGLAVLWKDDVEFQIL